MSYDERIEECKELLRTYYPTEHLDRASDLFHQILCRTRDFTIREVELARHVVLFKESTPDGKIVAKDACNIVDEEASGLEFVADVKHDEDDHDQCVLLLYSKRDWDILQEEKEKFPKYFQ